MFDDAAELVAYLPKSRWAKYNDRLSVLADWKDRIDKQLADGKITKEEAYDKSLDVFILVKCIANEINSLIWPLIVQEMNKPDNE